MTSCGFVLLKTKRYVDSGLISGYFHKKVRKKITHTILQVVAISEHVLWNS